jgi:hypothetical protein
MKTGHSKTNRELRYNIGMGKCKSPHKLYRKFQNLAAWKYIHRKTGQPQVGPVALSGSSLKSLGGT